MCHTSRAGPGRYASLTAGSRGGRTRLREAAETASR